MDEQTRLQLLGELIAQLQDGKRPHDNLIYVYAHFFTKRGRLITDDINALKALDYLWNGVYYFEDYNLSDAHRVELHTH